MSKKVEWINLYLHMISVLDRCTQTCEPTGLVFGQVHQFGVTSHFNAALMCIEYNRFI